MVEFENGMIVTDLDDIDFFELVTRKWAKYPENEADALINGIEGWEIEEEMLRSEGFDILECLYSIEGEMLTLIKIDEGKWVVIDYSVDQVEELVGMLEDT